MNIESHASSLFNEEQVTTSIQYQSASKYTHLNWFPEQSMVNRIELLPIINFSGIPIEDRKEKANYFNHGKIPYSVNDLFAHLLQSSHYFQTKQLLSDKKSNASDYQFQLQINQYQLPFEYAPDDHWWTEFKDDVNRWILSESDAQISLTLKITGKKMSAAPWSRTIVSTISSCNLNQKTQSLSLQNSNRIIAEYAATTSGQAFISASNFLILQAIHHINKNNHLANVEKTFGNEIFIVSNKQEFSIGQKLNLYHNNLYSNQSDLPAGQVQIIKTYKNQAVAYPVNLRVDQIKPGDWIEVNQTQDFVLPTSIFNPKYYCGKDKVAEI